MVLAAGVPARGLEVPVAYGIVVVPGFGSESTVGRVGRGLGGTVAASFGLELTTVAITLSVNAVNHLDLKDSLPGRVEDSERRAVTALQFGEGQVMQGTEDRQRR